jgi:hypothetical protein
MRLKSTHKPPLTGIREGQPHGVFPPVTAALPRHRMPTSDSPQSPRKPTGGTGASRPGAHRRRPARRGRCERALNVLYFVRCVPYTGKRTVSQ